MNRSCAVPPLAGCPPGPDVCGGRAAGLAMLVYPVTASVGVGTMPTARTVFGQRAQPWVNRNLFPAWVWPVVSPDPAARRSFSRTTKFWSHGSGGQRSLHLNRTMNPFHPGYAAAVAERNQKLCGVTGHSSATRRPEPPPEEATRPTMADSPPIPAHMSDCRVLAGYS